MNLKQKHFFSARIEQILFSAHKSQNVFQFLFEAIEDLFYFCFSLVNSKPSLILIHPSMFKFPFLAEAFFLFSSFN